MSCRRCSTSCRSRPRSNRSPPASPACTRHGTTCGPRYFSLCALPPEDRRREGLSPLGLDYDLCSCWMSSPNRSFPLQTQIRGLDWSVVGVMLADAVATTRTPVSVNQSHLGDIARAGTPVPDYDRTRLRPGIVHVGVGGFHRAHLALYTHHVAAAAGAGDIVGRARTPQAAAMRDVLERQDNLYTLVERGPGEPAVQIIGSI